MKRIMAKIERWNAERISIRELNQLTNRELHDLGIYRGDIRRIVRGT